MRPRDPRTPARCAIGTPAHVADTPWTRLSALGLDDPTREGPGGWARRGYVLDEVRDGRPVAANGASLEPWDPDKRRRPHSKGISAIGAPGCAPATSPTRTVRATRL